jgi:putative ABC transport system permease protein
MLLNAFLIALREIRRNLTRSFLTVIGVVIGVAAVVTMVTLGRGATEAVKGQISKMGSNLLVLRPGQGWGSWGAPQFSIADSNAIRDQVAGIASLAPFVQTNVKVVYQENDRSSDIQGTTVELFRHQQIGWSPSAASSPRMKSRPAPAAASLRDRGDRPQASSLARE